MPLARRLLVACTLLVLALSTAPASAVAATSDQCGDDPTAQPFLPWLDPMEYVFVRNGGFEAGSPAWALTGDASVQSGNETFYVHSADDRQSVVLPAGASATSPRTCMGLQRPSLRFFLKRTSTGLLSATALIKVDVLFTDLTGTPRTLPIAALPATESWQPSVPLFVGADKLPALVPDPVVQFRFTAIGGTFRVDDIYVDPYGNR